MKPSLRIKMIVSFLLIISISCVATFWGALLVSKNPISEEIKVGQFSYADNLLTLDRQTDLTIQQILDVNVNSIYATRILDKIDQNALNENTVSKLENGEKVYVFSKLFASPYTLLKLDDEVIRISIRKQDVFAVFRFRIALILLSILIISCILLALFSSRMLRPITKLTEATQKVARGDFDTFVNLDSRDEIGILIRNFNQMAKELGNMEYLQKDFIRNVSHEFKTPISSIEGFAKLLQKEDLTSEERIEYAKIIMEESDRLSKLSSNILRLSKLENQEELDTKKEFLLDEQIRSVIVLLEPKWSVKGLNLDVQMDKTQCVGDEELLQQVWINLLENAIKFSPDNSTISIRISKSESFVEAIISDQGIGMDENTAQRIFDKFFQGNTSHSSEGNGLGLSIVKRIIELSGGEIQCKSSLNQGTSFLVKLPR